MRSRRFELFRKHLERLPKPVSILDVGGTESYWRLRGLVPSADLRIVLLNLKAGPTGGGFESVGGDATDLSRWNDGAFDVAFSNSVIEHLFTEENQMTMAREVRRVARNHWIQTPNFWFPIEPHFLCPGWQWLPRGLRAAIVRRIKVGQRGPAGSDAQARALVDEIRLLSRGDVRRLFPTSRIVPERFLGLVKSWTAVGGTEFERAV